MRLVAVKRFSSFSPSRVRILIPTARGELNGSPRLIGRSPPTRDPRSPCPPRPGSRGSPGHPSASAPRRWASAASPAPPSTPRRDQTRRRDRWRSSNWSRCESSPAGAPLFRAPGDALAKQPALPELLPGEVRGGDCSCDPVGPLGLSHLRFRRWGNKIAAGGGLDGMGQARACLRGSWRRAV